MKPSKAEAQLRADTVGRFLRSQRIKASLTQKEVSERLRYKTPQFVSNWERGIALPPLDVLPKLVDLYGTAPLELINVIHSYQKQVLEMARRELLMTFQLPPDA